MIYVREIGEHFKLPGLSKVETHEVSLHSSHEAHQPPLYYALAAAPFRISRLLGADLDTGWQVVRLFTVLLGAGWVYFLYRLSREFLGRRRYAAVLAAACIGLLPLSTYIGGVINNDVAVALFFTAALWLVAKAIRRGEISRRAAVEIGIAAGLAVLSKAQGLFLLPLIAATALVLARWKGWKRSTPTIVNSLVAITVALAISSLWFVRNWYVYGSPILQSLYNPIIRPGDALGLADWVVATRLITGQLFDYFWTPFWLLQLDAMNQMRYRRLLVALCLVAFVGVVSHLRGCSRLKSPSPDCRPIGWLLFMLPGLLVYAFLFRHTLFVDKGALQQGRLMLPSAALFGAALVIGLSELIERPVIKVITGRVSSARQDAVRKSVSICLGSLLVAGLLVANLFVMQAIVTYYR
jgi:4-amino-4-deoxy-L-arabinose transferase-like glycosyltransferase